MTQQHDAIVHGERYLPICQDRFELPGRRFPRCNIEDESEYQSSVLRRVNTPHSCTSFMRHVHAPLFMHLALPPECTLHTSKCMVTITPIRYTYDRVCPPSTSLTHAHIYEHLEYEFVVTKEYCICPKIDRNCFSHGDE